MRLRKLISMLMGALCVTSMYSCNTQNQNVTVVGPQEFKEAVEQDRNGILLDVRKPEEYAEGHLYGAELMNWLDEEAFKQEAVRLDQGKTIYVYCRSGRRSNAAANYLASQGYKVVDMQGGILGWNKAGYATSVYDGDVFFTETGKRVVVTFIKHGTLMMDVNGTVVHIDPVMMFGTDYAKLPKADLLLVTHEHGDHYDKAAIELVKDEETVFLSNGRVAELSGQSEAMAVGDSRSVANGEVTVTATAAYNVTPGREKFHPQGRDVGFLIDVDDLRIYVSGDTEDIPEMASLKDVDVAFLSVNQPYTMTAEQCVRTIEMFSPKIVYPYHYGDTDLKPVAEYFKGNGDVEVRIRQLQ